MPGRPASGGPAGAVLGRAVGGPPAVLTAGAAVGPRSLEAVRWLVVVVVVYTSANMLLTAKADTAEPAAANA